MGCRVTAIGLRYHEDGLREYVNEEGNPRVRWVGIRRNRGICSKLTASFNSRIRGLETYGPELKATINELTSEKRGKGEESIVLSQFPPGDGIDLGYMVSKKLGCTWIHIHNDPYPEHLIPPPYNRPRPSVLGLFNIHYRTFRTFSMPHRVIFPCKRLLEFQSRILPHIARNAKSRWRVVPHMGIKPAPPLKPDGVFRVCHVGRLYGTRNPTGIVEAWKRFVQDVGASIPVELLQIGSGRDDPLSKFANMPATRVLPMLPYAEAQEWMRKAAVLLLLEAPMTEGIFLPSKLPDYVGCRRPILALSPVDGTIADLFAQFDGGLRVDPLDSEQILNALLALYEEYRRLSIRPGPLYPKLEEYFHPEHVSRLYQEVFQEP